MKRYGTLCIILLLAVTLVGCESVKTWLGNPDTTTRIMAGLSCLTALATNGIQVAVDPALGFTTASDVLAAIVKIGTAAVQVAMTQACQDTIALAAEDAQGAVTMLQATQAVPPPQVPRLKGAFKASAPPKAAPGPVRVVVPIR